MAKVSCLIPSRNEQFMPQTVDDLFAKAAGDLEVIVVLDGYWPTVWPKEHPKLTYIHRSQARGMRAGINAAAGVATGQYLMKLDGHCMLAEGFDEVLQADCEHDWLVIPRRVSLDAENWTILDTRKSPVDYEYLSCPIPIEDGMHGAVWRDRARERLGKPEYEIDDDMSFQGSCWFMRRSYFWEHIGGMSEVGYGTFIQEPQEIGLKVWLGGGRQVVNKRTWYAHLHKGKRYGRGYHMDRGECIRGNVYSTDFWINNRWEKRVQNIDWLIAKFWPVPGWPEDWRTRWESGEWKP